MVGDPISRHPKKAGLTEVQWKALLTCFSPDQTVAAERYEVYRKRLIHFFAWERCPFPEEGTDETINRVARRLEEGVVAENLERYILGVARLVAKEALREAGKARSLRETPAPGAPDFADTERQERCLTCLRECLAALPADKRDFITAYYQGEEGARIRNRQEMAQSEGIPLNALRNRALRLREKLEHCMSRCLRRSERP
jgi:DNA-directed RNA polymerase specialized sigma24 family protein